MRKVDAFLSRLAQQEWPTAIVWAELAEGNGVDRYILERYETEDILLGNRFNEVRVSLDVLLSSERVKKSLDKKEAKHGDLE